MNSWPSAKASRVLRALIGIGWTIQSQTGSHRTLSREGRLNYVFAFHDGDEIGPRMLAVAELTAAALPARATK